jgi:glycosyltransferase involved in cell wall biosynthesis
MRPAISCIIPTYNRPEVISDTIRQLLDQTEAARDIIVIDQTRNYPLDVEREMMNFVEDGKIVWLCQIAPNASMARNTGAVLATGEILLFLDDDIKINSGFLRAHLQNYQDSECDAVSGQVLDGDGSVLSERLRHHPDLEWDSLLFPKNFGKRVKTAWTISCNFSVRKSVYFELGGMDEWYERGAFREESDFAFRYLRSGRMFQFDPGASLYHLGQHVVSGGGCRSFTSVWGGWHHFVGSWYFTLGFAKQTNFIQMVWQHWRGLAFNAASLRKPLLFVARVGMFLAAFPIAVSRRFRGAKLMSRKAYLTHL